MRLQLLKMELQGKVAVVTGAARGLGKCITQTLLQRGAKVCFCDISAKDGEKTRDECAERYGTENIIFKHCDVCKESELKDVIEIAKKFFKRIDIFINNAAVVDETNWEKMLEVNLGGYIRGTSLAIDYMRKDKGGNGGVIVNVSSISGYSPTAHVPIYTASKYGVTGYSRTMALRPEVKENGIRITCLCPSIIDTPLLHQTLANKSGWEHTILKRMVDEIGSLSVEQVTDAVLKLLNDEDNNGGVLYVDKTHGIGYNVDDNPISKHFSALQY